MISFDSRSILSALRHCSEMVGLGKSGAAKKAKDYALRVNPYSEDDLLEVGDVVRKRIGENVSKGKYTIFSRDDVGSPVHYRLKDLATGEIDDDQYERRHLVLARDSEDGSKEKLDAEDASHGNDVQEKGSSANSTHGKNTAAEGKMKEVGK